jgi:iron(III) transport system substrate-binding protein
VLAFDPARTPPDRVPPRWIDLDDAGTASSVAFANPLFGTTRGHVAAMVALWGREETAGFLTGLRERGASMVDGNSAAVREVLAGRSALAATDTDDVVVANRQGASLHMRYPDMGDGGTLLIPNSVAILAGSPRVDTARELVDFLVSADVEELLARSASRNIPVRVELRQKLGVEMPPQSDVSYTAVADAMPEAAELVREILIR